MANNPFLPVPPLPTSYVRPPTLTEAQKIKLSALITNRFGTRPCEFCGHSNWAMGDNLVSPLPLRIDHVRRVYSVDHNVVHASVHVVCTICGNTKLFHLAQLGFDPFAPENQ